MFQWVLGEDYHISLKRILDSLADELENKFNAKCMVFVDTGPLSDRAVAVKSGTGYIGKNTSLVSKNGGSGVFLGYILTDLELEKTKTSDDTCGSCKKCILSCPAGAISENGFCTEKCISYITQKKGVLTEEEMTLMGTDIFGCDVCHKVCPKTRVIEEEINADDIFPLAEEILELDNGKFKERFGNTAMSFRGRNIIRRNVICALSNIGTEESLELIKRYTNDDSDIVSKTALMAVKKMEK
ncbi:MAG: tRNA epoxyqueuosine(34) reductase QueG [Lachnospiraceae bacterium]|nr:tRNA epoxyqueuosine(34) reductase QueG [Lachnospiraceae bacterium]